MKGGGGGGGGGGGYSMFISRGSGDMLQKKILSFLCYERASLRLDGRLETIKWPFLD